jgi:cbb3-type cytochrome oxidase subunit 1
MNILIMEANKNEHTEGQVTKTIENQTAKLPSDIYLGVAIAAMGISLVLKLTGKRHASLFVGQWVAPFLLFGIYNKIVKTQGSE